jgi:hypothetical protein
MCHDRAQRTRRSALSPTRLQLVMAAPARGRLALVGQNRAVAAGSAAARGSTEREAPPPRPIPARVAGTRARRAIRARALRRAAPLTILRVARYPTRTRNNPPIRDK